MNRIFKKIKISLIVFILTELFVCYWQSAAAIENSLSQANDNKIREYAFDTPERLSNNIFKLTSHLTKPYRSDYDKLKSIAYWIASHIAYDNYKYDNGQVNHREIGYEYDTLQAKAGVCGDFAELFKKMADIANINHVEIISGYTIDNQTRIRRHYSMKDFKGENKHAWNKVTLDRKVFLVDTTFMAAGRVTANKTQHKSSFKHKTDIKRRTRHAEINRNIKSFYFDFTPKQELREYKSLHIADKFIR